MDKTPPRPRLRNKTPAPAVRVLAAGVLSALSAATAAAAGFPDHPIQVIVPYTAGGNTDVMARGFFDAMQRQLGISTFIVNRDGAGGSLGFAQLKNAKADGYTIVFSPSSPISSAPFLIRKLPYRADDFVPVCQVFENVYTVAVSPGSKFKTLNQLVDAARGAPGAVSFGTSGIGSVGHLTGEEFARKVGVRVNHIPFRGDGQMIPQVVAGQVDFAVAGMGSSVGMLRPLAVFSDTRLAFLPAVPTATELGLPSSHPGYQGIFVPKGTPPEVVGQLEKSCQAVTTSAQFVEFGNRQSQKVKFTDSRTFAKDIEEDTQYKRQLISDLGL